MSTMHLSRCVSGSAALEAAECSMDYCEETLSVALVEAGDELRALCRACRKDLWGVSS